MGETTGIEWATSTHNEWIGCSAKCSPGCANCYAAARAKRWGEDFTKPRRSSKANRLKPLSWNRKAEAASKQAPWGGEDEAAHVRPRIFCGSLMDWLDPEVPIEWLADLLALIAATPHLDWLLLTKRPQLWRERLSLVMVAPGGVGKIDAKPARWLNGTPPANVWMLTTAEDQRRLNERLPELLRIPALVRGLSCEPLLGPLDLNEAVPEWWESVNQPLWVICGGESGPNARPMHPQWARSLRDQCKAADVPFLFKQWGAWGPVNSKALAREPLIEHFGERPYGKSSVIRVGKKAAGRLLDGKTHDEFPS